MRFAGTCIAIGTATQEGLTLTTYLRTRNHIEDGRGPWALETELWTSILLFAASVLTVILGVIMIAAYLISIRAANKVSSVQTYFAVAIELGHIGLWIGVAVGYRVSVLNRFRKLEDSCGLLFLVMFGIWKLQVPNEMLIDYSRQGRMVTICGDGHVALWPQRFNQTFKD